MLNPSTKMYIQGLRANDMMNLVKGTGNQDKLEGKLAWHRNQIEAQRYEDPIEYQRYRLERVRSKS